jgi:hypothetical protein
MSPEDGWGANRSSGRRVGVTRVTDGLSHHHRLGVSMVL